MRRVPIYLLLVATLVGSSFASAEQHGALLLPPPNELSTSVLPVPSEQEAPANPHVAEEVLPIPKNIEADERFHIEPNVVRIEELPEWSAPAYWLGPEPWETSVELGINGSSGTSESLSMRAGGTIKRESRFSKLNLNSSYNFTTENGNDSQNNAQFDVRNDWLLDDESPWTLYGTGEVFYDEFQAFDLQTSANMGVGYRFVHEPELKLIGRVGGGASREFGGPDDRWVPESLFGFEYNQHLTAAQKFYGKLDYYPEWKEIGEFRAVADIGWQIQFAEPSNMSLKVSISDRYDSTPNGAEPHLLNYSVLLLLKL